MSDHEAGATGQDVGSMGRTYSSNGHEPGDGAADFGDPAGSGAGDGTSFLAELARAMQTTAAAEQARNAEGTEQRRQTHIDGIRAREALEAEELRELAKEDVKGIDAWSDGEIKRIKLERERRIAARREQLQIRLEEHRNVVGREVDAVEAAIAAYKADIEQYFRRLDAETDPVLIAQQAGTRPPFPVLELIGPDDAPVTSDYAHHVSQAVPPASTPHVAPDATQASAETGADAPPVANPWEAAAPAVEAPSEEPNEVPNSPVATAVSETPASDPVTGNGLVGVMDPGAGDGSASNEWDAAPEPVAAEATDDVAVAETGSEDPSESDRSPEPVAAIAEARVVMPRSTGAGSWLRWPNSSADHSDGAR